MTQPAESNKPASTRAVEPPSESLEQLAVKQGVRPVRDLDALAARWPADDDPDAFDAFLRQQRASRRSAAQGKR